MVLFSQTAISVSIKDCRKTIDSDRHGFREFSLYKNDSLYGEYNINNSSLIDSLPYGRYYIEYNTYFGKRKSESQQIDKDSFLPGFDVCVDEFPEDLRENTPNLLIDNLKEGDELPIYRNYPNCYTKRDNIDSLIVKKQKGKYYIVRNKKKYRLNQKQVEILRDFEIQMRTVKSGFYSTSECYTWIGRDEDIISFYDSRGNWEGYEYLLIQLRIVKKRKSFPFREKYK
jgi:hypothetical protein